MARKQHIDYSQPFKFTKTSLEGVPKGGNLAYFYDTKVPQLGVTRQLSGKLTFHVRTTSAETGKTKRIGIRSGRFPGMAVDTAREKALSTLADEARGIDTIAARRSQRVTQAVTGLLVKDALNVYLDEKRTGKQKLPLKDRTKSDYRYDIEYLLGDDYESPLVGITEDLIAKRVRKMEKRSQAKAAAGCRSLSAIWNWTRKQKKNRGLVPENPVTLYAESIDGLYVPLPKSNYLKEEYISEWFDEVEAIENEKVSQFYQFLILSGVRLNEALDLQWQDINFKTNTYVLPDPKNRKSVEFPVPRHLRGRLYSRRQSEGLVFNIPNKGRLHRANIAAAIEFDWTHHDLRRTFATYGLRVCDLVKVKLLMNHLLSGDITMGSYVQREGLDLRGELQKIEAEILRLAGRPVSNVVRLVV